ncbi:hypothetical protein C8R47DRAFT_1216089 [Mycena vitilis]|nr:hypothetical protein C8R47DRAFT_1216089 [Mycena vitilis]
MSPSTETRRMMTETVIESDDDHLPSALAAWEAFDDDTRPDALRILAFALKLRQERMTIECHDAFVAACKKARENSSLLLYKKKEDARRALDRCRLLPPGVPEDCPVTLVDGVIEVLPLDGEDFEDDSDEENHPPRTLSQIDQDECDADSTPVQSHEEDAVQSQEDVAADAAAAASTLDALADQPSPHLSAGLLPSPDLPSPTYNSHAQPQRCREFDRACRYAYGPPGLEGQTDGENVERPWVRLRRTPAAEQEFRQGFARGLARAWEMALTPPSPSSERGDDRPEHVQEEWSSLTQLLAPGRGEPDPRQLSSGDLTLAEIQEVEDAWVRVLRAAQRENEEHNQVAAALLPDGTYLFSRFCVALLTPS